MTLELSPQIVKEMIVEQMKKEGYLCEINNINFIIDTVYLGGMDDCGREEVTHIEIDDVRELNALWT